MRAAVPFLASAEALKVHFALSLAYSALGLASPPAAASAFLFLAWGTGRILGSLGGPVLFHVLAKLAVFAAAFLGSSVLFGYPAPTELSGAAADWVRPAAALACAGIHGLRGFWLERRNPDHAFCLSRFDEGAGLFLVILSIAALTGSKAPPAAAAALPFLAFSILSLGLARGERDGSGAFRRRSFLAGLLPLTALFLGAAGGLALLVPLLTEPAALAGEVLARGAPALLRFLGRFLSRIYRLETAAPRLSEGGSNFLPREADVPGDGSLSDIFIAVLGGIAVFLAAALAAAALVRLIRRLASPSERRRPLDLSFTARWLSAIKAFLRRVMINLGSLRSPGGSSPALKAYARLLAVGRVLGMSRTRDETPREYTRRLAAAYPRGAAEAGFVVGCLEREVYGGKPRDPDTDRRLAAARRGMRLGAFVRERLARPGRGDAKRPVRILRVRRSVSRGTAARGPGGPGCG